MGLEVMGMKLDMIGSLWILIALCIMIAIGGAFMYVWFSRIHPKGKFKIYARTGVFTREYRLYYGKVPTELDIFSLLLGKRPVGFPITWFSHEFYEVKKFGIFSAMDKYFIAQSIDYRLFPLPLHDKLGVITFVMQKCPKCGISDKLWNSSLKNCPSCNEKLVYEPHAINALDLQRLKYNPETETRAIYSTEIDKDKMLPLAEYLAVYDVGAKIAEAMASNNDDNKQILDQNNPFITAIIESLPLAIIMIGFGVAAYVMWQGMGDSMNTGATLLKDASSNFAEGTRYLYNATTLMNKSGMLK